MGLCGFIQIQTEVAHIDEVWLSLVLFIALWGCDGSVSTSCWEPQVEGVT